MNEDNRGTRAYLKRLPPNDAEKYLLSFNFPDTMYKIMYYLYVKKIPDIWQVTYKLESEKIFISGYKAGELHRQAVSWISESLKTH